MAAPTLQAQGTIASGVISGVPAVTIPTHQADDILVVVAMVWVPATTTPDAAQIPTPSGWTLLGTQIGIPTASPRDGWIAAFWQRATAAGTTVTLTRGAGWDTGTDTCFNARAYVIRGCITTGDPFDAVATAGVYTTANQNLPAVTVSGAERTVLIFGGASDNLAFSMASAGWTAGTAAVDGGGTDSAFQTVWKENVNASTTAAASTVTAPAAGGYGFIGVSFKPVVGVLSLLEGDVTLAIAPVAAALTTEIQLASTATLQAIATADLTAAVLGFGSAPFGAYGFGHPEPPAAAAEFAASVTLAVTTAGALTTAIQLNATPTLALTTAAQLTTTITLAAAPTVRITTAAALTTEIRLAATPTVRITTAAALTTELRLAGAATLAITTSAPLTTSIALASAVTLRVTTAPAVITTEIRLAATPTLQVTTTAALTAIPAGLGGEASLRITTAANLTTAIQMAGTAILAVTTTAPLTTEIRLAGAPRLAVSTAGALTTAITLAATPTLQVTTTANLEAAAGLAGQITVRITTSASLTTAVGIAGAATLRITATAALTTYTPLAATAALAVHTAADLFAEAPMFGAATLRIMTAADLTTELRLAGNAVLAVLAQGLLGSIPPTIINPSVRPVRPGRTTQPIPAGRVGVVTGAGRTVGNGIGPRTTAPVRPSRHTMEHVE